MAVLFQVQTFTWKPSGAQVIRETELQNNAAPHTNTPPPAGLCKYQSVAQICFPIPGSLFKMELFLEMDQRNKTMHYSKCTAAARNVT